jgi:DNA processing protein
VWSRAQPDGQNPCSAPTRRFSARNRIIAGLCAATVVVEAREASGALITADLALEEGREVFACPGEITSALSSGSNALLRLGATPLTAARDVLESFGIEETGAHQVEVGGPAQAVLNRLRDAAESADELARATELDAAELAVALSELELAGLAVQADGVYRAVSH